MLKTSFPTNPNSLQQDWQQVNQEKSIHELVTAGCQNQIAIGKYLQDNLLTRKTRVMQIKVEKRENCICISVGKYLHFLISYPYNIMYRCEYNNLSFFWHVTNHKHTFLQFFFFQNEQKHPAFLRNVFLGLFLPSPNLVSISKEDADFPSARSLSSPAFFAVAAAASAAVSFLPFFPPFVTWRWATDGGNEPTQARTDGRKVMSKR